MTTTSVLEPGASHIRKERALRNRWVVWSLEGRKEKEAAGRMKCAQYNIAGRRHLSHVSGTTLLYQFGQTLSPWVRVWLARLVHTCCRDAEKVTRDRV